MKVVVELLGDGGAGALSAKVDGVAQYHGRTSQGDDGLVVAGV